MSSPRALRVLFVANDGMSAGHVARTIAVARALSLRAAVRDVPVARLFATTSEAHALFADPDLAVVTLPAPVRARAAGLSDADRRRIVAQALGAAASAFAPDLVVVDTFPSGPHGELGEVLSLPAKRALLRRDVPRTKGDGELTRGLDAYDLAIVADDPTPQDVTLPVPIVRVPPIVRGARPADERPIANGTSPSRGELTRADARRALGLARDGEAILVVAGGGGDPDGVARSRHIADTLARLAPDVVPVLGVGPLAPPAGTSPAAPRVVTLARAPLGPWLAAFDGAFSAAGYNTAHELAHAGVPAALFAEARPFDDQAARALRFEAAGYAHHLTTDDDGAIARALAWLRAPSRRPRLVADGADRAADALLDLVTRSASTTTRHAEGLVG